MALSRRSGRDSLESFREEWERLVDFCVSNNIAVDSQPWQPIVAPLHKWTGRSVDSIVEKGKKIPELDLNLSFKIFSKHAYRSDDRYALKLFPQFKEELVETTLLVYFPTIYNGHSLNVQLTDHVNYSPNSAGDKLYIWVDLLYRALTRVWPEYPVKLIPHGSLISGLAMKKGSLNICIELEEPDIELLNDYINRTGRPLPYSVDAVMDLFYQEQANRDNVTGFIRFTMGTYPIEINFNKEITTEPTNLIIQYMKLDPRVKPLLYAIKLFGRARSLFAPYFPKGLRFYPYTIMVLAYLISLDPPVIPNLQRINQYDSEDDCHDENCRSKRKYWDTVMNNRTKVGISARFHDCVERDPTKPSTKYYAEQDENENKLYWNSANTMGVGELFQDFLHYYGYRFDFEKYAVSAKFGGRIPKKSGWMNDLVAIEDPFMSHINLGEPIEDMKRFTGSFRGSFTVLQSGITFDTMSKRIGEIIKYDSQRGIENERREYVSYKSWGPSVTSKSFLLIDLPKEVDEKCYCDRIRNLFSTHGVITKLLDLDATTKQVFFNADTGNAKDILLPDYFTLDGKTVYIVELYDYFVFKKNKDDPMLVEA